MATNTVTRNGCSYGPPTTVSVGGSPFTLTSTENCPILVTVSGGTVTNISMASDLLGLINLGLLGGTWQLNPGQSIQVTYLLTPNIVYWPI